MWYTVNPWTIVCAPVSASYEQFIFPIEFGFGAGSWSAVPLEVSTRWTSPEFQQARDRKAETVAADTSTDIWAFGIMGYELLTGKPAFPPGLPRGTIRRMLLGKAPLPWEDHANSSELTEQLEDNEMKGIVLSCLARKPSIRPHSAALAATFSKIMAASAPAAPLDRSAAAAAAPEDTGARTEAADGSADSDDSREASASFLRAPLIDNLLENSSAVAPNSAVDALNVDGSLRVGPAGLAVSAKRGSEAGLFDGDNSTWAIDTLDNTSAFQLGVSKEGLHAVSGGFPSEMRSEKSVTAAMW